MARPESAWRRSKADARVKSLIGVPFAKARTAELLTFVDPIGLYV
jgi:hypothetical protein